MRIAFRYRVYRKKDRFSHDQLLFFLHPAITDITHNRTEKEPEMTDDRGKKRKARERGGETMELSEKAILGLECCLETIDDESCPEICPYYSECMKHEKRCIFQYVMRDALSVLKAQENGWISVKDAMPPERETIFAKFKGTVHWNPAMFATGSEDVRVVVQFEDGTRKVWHDNTMDGKWKCEREKCAYPKRTVTHWMPNPDLPKEG